MEKEKVRFKMEKVKQILIEKAGTGRLCILFSGGVDSTLLAALAGEALGTRAVLATFDSTLEVPSTLEKARFLAKQLGLEQRVVRTDELSDPRVASNPTNRCYFCRKYRDAALFASLRGEFCAVVDGTNADDKKAGDRPGLIASDEDGIGHPLAEAGLAKEEVRQAAKALGLPNWDLPSAPCLATRFAFGLPLKREELLKIAQVEEEIKALGFPEVRVRKFFGSAVFLEVPDPFLIQAVSCRETLIPILKKLGPSHILLDLEGFASGKFAQRNQKEVLP